MRTDQHATVQVCLVCSNHGSNLCRVHRQQTRPVDSTSDIEWERLRDELIAATVSIDLRMNVYARVHCTPTLFIATKVHKYGSRGERITRKRTPR
jgi:hypothetical protein